MGRAVGRNVCKAAILTHTDIGGGARVSSGRRRVDAYSRIIVDESLNFFDSCKWSLNTG